MVCGATAPLAAQAPANDSPATTRTAAEEQARAHYRTGSIAFAAGRFADALAEFQKSHALSQRPELIYNIAVAFDRLRRDRDALESFEEYLRLVPDASQRDEVEGRIGLLREALQSRDAATTANTNASPAPTATGTDVALEVTASQSSQVPATQATRATSAEQAAHPNTVQWLALGGSAVLAVTGGVLLTVAFADKRSVEQPTDGVRLPEIASAHDRVRPLMTLGGVMLGVGLAGVGAAVTWILLTGPGGDVEAQVGVGHVGIRGRF